MDLIRKESSKESYVVQIEIKNTWITQKEYLSEKDARLGLENYIQKAIERKWSHFHYRVVKISEICEVKTIDLI